MLSRLFRNKTSNRYRQLEALEALDEYEQAYEALYVGEQGLKRCDVGEQGLGAGKGGEQALVESMKEKFKLVKKLRGYAISTIYDPAVKVET